MMKITLISPGRLKESYLRDAAAEYSKRLSRFCSLSVIEPEPQRLPERPSESLVLAALEAEARIILKKIPDDAFVIALCVEGKPLSSEVFAQKLSELSAVGKPLVLVIGSSFGLSEKVKKRADMRLSVSAMTFPHQLFRIMLLEQIYRAFQINSGSEYHK